MKSVVTTYAAFLLGAVVVLVLLIVVWSSQSTSSLTQSSRAGGSALSTTIGSSAQETKIVAEPRALVPSTSGVSGRVEDDRGITLGGARIDLRFVEQTNGGQPRIGSLDTTSEQDGSFRIGWADGRGTATLTARKQGNERVSVTICEPPEAPLIVRLKTLGGAVLVTKNRHGPVSGATVFMNSNDGEAHYEGVTNHSGEVAWEGVLPRVYSALVTSDTGLLRHRESNIDWTSHGVHRHEVMLGDALDLRVIVKDIETGEGVPYATLRRRRLDGKWITDSTDENGQCKWRGYRAMPVTTEVSATNYGTARVQVIPGESAVHFPATSFWAENARQMEEGVHQINLYPSMSLWGRWNRGDRKLNVEVETVLLDRGRLARSTHRGRWVSDDEWIVESVPLVQNHLVVLSDKYGSVAFGRPGFLARPRTEVVCTPVERRSLAIETAGERREVATVIVRERPWVGRDTGRVGPATMIERPLAFANGRATIDNVACGDVDLDVRFADARGRASVRVDPSKDITPVFVNLVELASVSGLVLRDGEGVPFVHLSAEGSAGRWRVTTNQEGEFAVRNVPADEYEVTVRSSRGMLAGDGGRRRVVIDGRRAPVVLDLSDTQFKIDGRLSGNSIANGFHEFLLVEAIRGSVKRSGEMDEAGEFCVVVPDAGPWSIRVKLRSLHREALDWIRGLPEIRVMANGPPVLLR